MSGGFYKYRCKYFYTHNCPSWVWVHGAPCPTCLAEGRDEIDEITPVTQAPPLRASRQICVPSVTGGTLGYTLMDIMADQSGTLWTAKQKPQPTNQAVDQPATTTTTSDTPNPVVTTAGVFGKMY